MTHCSRSRPATRSRPHVGGVRPLQSANKHQHIANPTTVLKELEDSQFVLNQQTMIGMAEYVPIAARKSAAYWRCLLSCTTRRMMKPVSETAMVPTMNAKRIRSQSDAVAVSIASANAHAQGGTESSCVRIAPYPSDRMIVGAKYAVGARWLSVCLGVGVEGRGRTVAVRGDDEAEVHEASDDDFPWRMSQ